MAMSQTRVAHTIQTRLRHSNLVSSCDRLKDYDGRSVCRAPVIEWQLLHCGLLQNHPRAQELWRLYSDQLHTLK